MKLTEDQIKDLESRGIKPGVKLYCAFFTLDEFMFESWDDIYIKDGNFCFGYDSDVMVLKFIDQYATPIQ